MTTGGQRSPWIPIMYLVHRVVIKGPWSEHQGRRMGARSMMSYHQTTLCLEAYRLSGAVDENGGTRWQRSDKIPRETSSHLYDRR
jgi:hypothetical protein